MQKDLTLDLSCSDFELDKVKQSLATQYKVDLLFITLTNPCAMRRRARSLQSGGGLTLTLTISATATAADGTQVSTPPMASLLSAVQSVDDAALGSSLGRRGFRRALPPRSSLLPLCCSAALLLCCSASSSSSPSSSSSSSLGNAANVSDL